MNKVIALITSLVFAANIGAQTPNMISYQAVIRNSDNRLVCNKPVGMQINILQDNPSGHVVYSETFTPTTDENGLISIQIGSLPTFNTIDWSIGTYFIQTKTDPSGGSQYTLIKTTQILSVPYALHAQTAKTVLTPPTESDPIFSAWNKSTGITIKESQITDFKTYLTQEQQGLADVVAISNAANAQIKNVSNPTQAQDAATKAYVDQLAERISQLEDAYLLSGGLVDSRDGNKYEVVKINNTTWMAENLKYLPMVVGSGSVSSSTPKYSVNGYTGTDVGEAKTTYNYQAYGVLYNWQAARTACPEGWRLPNDEEWTQLETYLSQHYYNFDGSLSPTNTSAVRAKIAKSMAVASSWTDSETEGAVGNTDYPNYRNKSDFSALPGGCRNNLAQFNSVGSKGFWWSNTSSSNSSKAWGREIYYYTPAVVRIDYDKANELSVRCIKK